ncbi:MAG: GGDEF domain-containing protein [Gammaproteobacteria bacterium]|jgi:diguanylate cyclase|uniref:GGDEF domain-containing protein n=1 Tax=Marinomonas sp. BSi20584 TaxID=1594462 RepID=UPI000C1EDA58|nr:GGDEF domain-containing protein [Marinomonas sp. BSi20584]MBU1464806.1 GGDEF domain-containing protein [Gammaproteobacteria bacterium]MBU2023256.1 GGDEF domain-containing protein [Gammaproteobacteria bacterium]MBU2321092.1 GGDEF domain-containing protein [Gammaproteobacteria bacterium]MBU2414793.1 GGDEF domain-containing protein [Gammaproteobacteria bacterium]PJE56041.1 diguanylate cyclase [Marinomonas sp. BSi20584]
MTESSSDKLIEALRKAVSRTSMLAEGNDPELDSVVRQIRQVITKGADAQEIQDVLNNAEPLLIKSDEAQSSRAKQVRSTLQELIDLLEKQDSKRVPQNEKKELEAQIRLHWQTPSKWPHLLKGFLSLAEKTLTQIESSQPKSSLFRRFFNRDLETKSQKNDQEIMIQISHTLAGLMNNLSLPSHYDEDIVDLKKALLGNDNLQQLPGLLDEAINLIMIAIGKTQESLTNYLNQLNKQLASINESISSSYHSQKSLSVSREGFNNKLQKQVTDTSQAVQSANDLESLKTLINNRLSTISSTMTEYKTQMVEQEKHANQSISLLKNKVTRMEKDTVSLRSLLQEKLAQAMTDSLTDLPNRTAYQDAILPLCKIMQKTQKPICLAVCDIDHFKKVNDTWGHLAGDKVLRLVPKQIRSALLKEDLMFRYGGEEFVIAFPDTTLVQAIERAEAIRLAVAKTPFNMQGEPVSISISIGIAELHTQENPESLFARADKQLYMAKEAGRNRVMANK